MHSRKNPLGKFQRPKIPLKSLIAALNRPKAALRRPNARTFPKNPLGKFQGPKILLKSLIAALTNDNPSTRAIARFNCIYSQRKY